MSETTPAFTKPIYIHIQDGNETIYEKSFSAGPIYIGRSLTSDIPLPQYDWISRKHAKIEQRVDGCYLVDLGSSNGVKLRNKGYVKEVKVTSGLDVKIGGLVLSFSLEKAKVPHKPAQGDIDPTVELHSNNLDSKKEPIRTVVARPKQDKLPKMKKAPKANNKKSGKGTSKSLSDADTVFGDSPLESPSSSPLSSSNHDGGILGDLGIDGLETMTPNTPYEGVNRLPKRKRAVEVYVTWKGQVIDSVVCRRGETLYAGRDHDALYIPTIKGRIPLVDFRRSDAYCILPTTKGSVTDDRGAVAPIASMIHGSGKKAVKWSLMTSQALSIDIGNDILIHIRYAPTPRQLSRMPLAEIDLLMKQGIGLSTAAHLLLILLAIFLPRDPAPKIKNLSPRIARLLVQKPKPKPKPKPPEPKKIEPVVAKKAPPKKAKPVKKRVVKKRKIQRKPRKVVVRPNKRMKRINKVARVSSKVRSKGPISSKPPKKNVKTLGALAALGALGVSTPNPKNKPVSLNINPNAGGAPSNKLNATGLIGTLKSKNGRLAGSGGMPGVKTKGKGYGTGTGYGVQGVKGSAGTRGVAGAVIGTPKLMKVKRSEGLSQKQVMVVVKKKASKIQQCYERALLGSPGLQGRVEYGWFIRPNGKVKWAKVKNSSVRNADSLNNCVIKVFMSMRFPKAKNGAATQPSIGFPFGRM